jgi:hypothetical protein
MALHLAVVGAAVAQRLACYLLSVLEVVRERCERLARLLERGRVAREHPDHMPGVIKESRLGVSLPTGHRRPGALPHVLGLHRHPQGPDRAAAGGLFERRRVALRNLKAELRLTAERVGTGGAAAEWRKRRRDAHLCTWRLVAAA